MIIAWTKHLKDPEAKAQFEREIEGCKPVLKRLQDLLDEEVLNLDRSEMDIRSFDQPNWDYRQAFKNGYRSCLKTIDTLIDLDHQNKGN
jgi:hypothetical protein